MTAFPDDKQRAVGAYARVTTPGGYVGLNESTWRKVPPLPDVVAWAGQDLGANVKPLTSDEWVGLLEGAGLKDLVTETYEISTRDEAKRVLGRYGYGGMLAVFWRMLSLYARNPAYRKFVKEVREQGVVPENLEEYFGYGLYYVDCDAAGFGLGTHKALDSAVNVSRLVLAYHRALGRG